MAWVSEVKNTLSLPFYLLALDAWIDGEKGRPPGYVRSILYYLAAMLAKSSAIMLPTVLLLYCWWKNGRIRWLDFKRTIPFFAIGINNGSPIVLFVINRFGWNAPYVVLVGGDLHKNRIDPHLGLKGCRAQRGKSLATVLRPPPITHQ